MKMVEFFEKLETLRLRQQVLQTQLNDFDIRVNDFVKEAWQIDAGDLMSVKSMLIMFDKLIELRAVKTEVNDDD